MGRLVKLWLRLPQGQRGFSLIETVIAVAILGFVGAGVVLAIDTNSRASRTLNEQVVGINLATAYLEAIRELPYEKTYPEYSSAGGNISIPPQYSVSIDVDYSNDGSNWVDTWSAADQTIQRISITVAQEGGKAVLSMCTFRTEFY